MGKKLTRFDLRRSNAIGSKSNSWSQRCVLISLLCSYVYQLLISHYYRWLRWALVMRSFGLIVLRYSNRQQYHFERRAWYKPFYSPTSRPITNYPLLPALSCCFFGRSSSSWSPCTCPILYCYTGNGFALEVQVVVVILGIRFCCRSYYHHHRCRFLFLQSYLSAWWRWGIYNKTLCS